MGARAAVITGGSQGLGRVFARTLAEEGHDVAVLDLLDTDEVEQDVVAAGGRFLGVRGDAADPAQVADFATRVGTHIGPVRALVNNVGISPYRPFAEETLTSWRAVLRVNLDSAFLMTQAFLSDLRADGHGRIVNLTSSVVWDAAARDMVTYATTKAAIVGLTRGLATEMGPDGVTVNCIAPGIVLTPDIEERVPEEKLVAYRERQAIKQLARPEDLAATLRYLVDERSQMVTGTVQAVNGGRVWT